MEKTTVSNEDYNIILSMLAGLTDSFENNAPHEYELLKNIIVNTKEYDTLLSHCIDSGVSLQKSNALIIRECSELILKYGNILEEIAPQQLKEIGIEKSSYNIQSHFAKTLEPYANEIVNIWESAFRTVSKNHTVSFSTEDFARTNENLCCCNDSQSSMVLPTKSKSNLNPNQKKPLRWYKIYAYVMLPISILLSLSEFELYYRFFSTNMYDAKSVLSFATLGILNLLNAVLAILSIKCLTKKSGYGVVMLSLFFELIHLFHVSFQWHHRLILIIFIAVNIIYFRQKRCIFEEQ